MNFANLPSPSRRLSALLAATGLALGLNLAMPAFVQAQARELPDFTELVERVGPAVVNIRTSERLRAAPGGNADQEALLQELMRRFGIPAPGQRRGAPRGDDEQPQRRGLGSGFILGADGFVMTNAHVVDGADEITVTLTDKREFKAKLIGADKRTDVAIVKIEASALPVVKIGDVGRLKVGEWVMAIGSPFGFDNTVTAGIVSAKARDTGEFLPFIQTDVAINPGNSGGPLLNMRGEVVGINSQIYSQSGGFMGISFAIPIDEAMRVADQLRGGGRVVRGRIGVGIGDLSKEVAEALGLEKAQGVVVRSVEPGSPAEKGGVEAGDIIIKLDGRQLSNANDLRRSVAANKPGSKSVLQVFRRGAYKELTLVIGEMPAEDAAATAADPAAKAKPSALSSFGLTVSELSDAQKRDGKLRSGVLVDEAEGVAARAGLRAGDVILAVGKTEISSVKQLEQQLKLGEKAKQLPLTVWREGAVNYLLLKPAS
ncbi:Do family serine endopeptidase [Paucibacter sp. APW11]|uniref:Probable periplasmic serine endoprotease DegP-like n=1 Tax=Roseateles aquae TaxID=3077235 RepID=A0ABU3PFF6_9BURK|nr:Do family serine endopeptidase [Paucibacter sp. APW11]MDT9001283.1 Do family serine endopeptidase [Paucibacter sp. APW11]